MNAAYWLRNLAAWSAQAALLTAAGAAAVRIFRLRAPRVRLACWQALLAICLLLPAVEPWRRASDGRIDVSMGPPRVVASTGAPARPLPWREALLLALALGCATRAAWLAMGFGRLRGWRRASRDLLPPPHLERLRAVLAPRAGFGIASAVSGPVTFGLLRPLILLPPGFAALPVESQEAIACHELLHVRRHDWMVAVVEELAAAPLWFHPAVWWLMHEIQLAREQTVDAEVVAFTRDRRRYLSALLAVAGNHPAPGLAPATLFLRKRHLKKRVALLLEEITMSKRTLISFCAAASGVLFAAGWLALHTFPLQAAPAPQESPELLHRVAPVYPAAAKEKHIEGIVVLEADIDAGGHVTDARVLGGPPELRNAALTAVLQWHYSPKALTLPTTKQVRIDFTLSKDGAPDAAETRTAPPPEAPFTLKRVEVVGLTSPARQDLLSRLPVHAGDTVDAAAMQSLTETVHAFDDHLLVSATPAEGLLLIFLPATPPAGAPPAPLQIRVGRNVQQAKLLNKVHPVYPPEAKAQGIQGAVRLQATIAKDGTVANLQVLSGDSTLAAAALDAVRQWRYQTTLLNGDPVEVVTEIQVNFTLAP